MRRNGHVNVNERDLPPFHLPLAHERRLLMELIERDPKAAERLSSLLFGIKVQEPVISELQTTLWTA